MRLEVEGGDSRDDRVDSWGEIASYLRRDIKTVQQWERKSGMPVHRLVTGRDSDRFPAVEGVLQGRRDPYHNGPGRHAANGCEDEIRWASF